MRLFVAIEADEQVRILVRELQRELSPEARLVDADQVHLTLAFIGEVDEERLVVIRRELSRIRFEPLLLRTTQTGAFPPTGPARVLWLGIEGGEALAELQGRIAQACSARDARPYHPHLTIARMRGVERARITRFLCAKPAPITWRAERFTLYESRLSPRGPAYCALHVVDAQ